jgi:hypothetical protein
MAQRSSRRRTGSEARSTAEGTTGQQVPTHHSGTHKFQEQEQRVLELVVKARALQCDGHGARERRMCVTVEKETVWSDGENEFDKFF